MISRTPVPAASVLIAAVAITLALAGCTSAPAPTGGPTSSVSNPADSPPPGTAGSAVVAAPRLRFDQTHTYADGVTVRISAVQELKLTDFPSTDDPNAKAGDPYVVITLTFVNRSRAEVVLTPDVRVKIGDYGRSASRVYIGEARDELDIAPGKSTEYDVSAIIPTADRGTVVVEIIDTPDPSRNVVFAGSVD